MVVSNILFAEDDPILTTARLFQISWLKPPPSLAFSFHVTLYELTSATKKPSDYPLYWLVNRDPYNGLL